MGETPIKKEGTKPEKLKCNRRDRPRIHPMKIWQTFRQGLGCNLLKKRKGIPAKSQKKKKELPPFQTGLPKPRNGLPPLGAAIHPAFLIGGPSSLRNAGEGQVDNGLGRSIFRPRGVHRFATMPRKAREGLSDHRAPSI